LYAATSISVSSLRTQGPIRRGPAVSGDERRYRSSQRTPV